MPDIPLDREKEHLGVIFCCIQSLMCDPRDVASMFSWVSFASAGVSDFMRAAVRTRLKEAFEAGGTAAALVFLNYLRLKIHHPKHGSIRKAQWLTAAALAADQVRTAASLKPVQRSWARFRPVAHFWASFHLLRGSGEVRFETEEQALDWMILFMRGSDYLLWRAGIARLKFSDPWRLPGAQTPSAGLEELLHPMNSWELDVLADYSVRGKKRRL